MPRNPVVNRIAIAAAAVVLLVGCGRGDEKTLRELGSSKVDATKPDTTRLTSSSGDVRTVGRDSASRPASELRLRVRDRAPLDPSQVRKTPKAKKPKQD